MKVTYSASIASSKIELETYFPLIVAFHDGSCKEDYYQIARNDTDLLEFEVDAVTGLNLRMKLVVCKHYSIKQGSLLLPQSQNGELHFEGWDIFKYGSSEDLTDMFHMDIYSDGVRFSFSKEVAHQYTKTGNVVFGLTSSNKVSEIYVASMTAREIEHLKDELIADQ